MDVLLSCHVRLVFAFIVLILSTATSSLLPGFEALDEFEQSKSICKFQRTEEVERECHTILSSTPKVKLGVNGIYKVGQSLSFQNGDWVQEDAGAPLMPFDDSDMPKNITSAKSLLKLVSFWLMGIDFARQTQDAIGVCGVLSIGITRNRTLPYQPQHWYPWFHKSPGYADLTIVFEGLYVQSEGNEEDGLMCMLGTSVFPFSEGLTDFSTWPVEYDCNRKSHPPSMKEDRIMLVLRYPLNFTLTSRAVVGEMRSMNKRSDPKYFGNIHISSHLSYYHSSYMFASDKLVPKACNSHLYQEFDSRIEIFRGSKFCKVFQRFASEKFDIVAEMCNNVKNCSTLGPFSLEDEIERKANMLHNFRLMITDLHCVPGTTINKVRTAKVSGILRAVSSGEDGLTSGARSGLSGMTISAEGTWNSSSGQLCMIGCVGLENDLNRCNSQISLTLPVTLSIIQRSILIGTISNIEGTESFSPMLFSKKLHPSDLWNRYYEYSNAYLSYQYSKIEMANALMNRSKASNVWMLVKDMLSNYPSVEDSDNLTLLSSLSSSLSFHVNAHPDSNHGEKLPKTVVLLEVLSLGKLLGRYWPKLSNHKWQEQALKIPANSAYADRKLPLNISAHLTLTGDYYRDFADLHLEGLYDQFGGKIYLIGCRDIHIQHSQKIMHGNMDLGSQMDCLIEVIVAYTSMSTKWFKNPTAKVSIASQRNVDDPLYFMPVRLKTFLIPYTDNSKEVHFRRNFEDFFRILVLLGSITCLMRQVLYTEKKVNAIPFISLVMLAVQVLSYGLPLIMDTPVLFKWKVHHYGHSRFVRRGKTFGFQMLELIIKSLILVLLVLTLRLFQKVWNSRRSINKLLPLDHKPGEYRVFFSTLIVYTIGFLVILVSRELQTQKTAPAGVNPNPTDWGTIMEEYWVVVQDCFLLPQILGNIIWQVQSKPLSKVYYIGFTISRFLLRAYDYFRDPVFSHYFHELETRTSPEFFPESAKIVIMMVMVSLLLIVHAQHSQMLS